MPDKFTFTAKYGMKKVREIMKTQGRKAVKVGILRGTGDHPNAPGIPIALIAWWNEFGTKKNGKPHIPSRPFLRTTLREHGYYKEALKNALKLMMQDISRGASKIVRMSAGTHDFSADGGLSRLLGIRETSQDKYLGFVGQIAADDIKAKIVEGPWEPNAPRTIRKKSTSSGVKAVPLVESGRMRQSIAWVLSND